MHFSLCQIPIHVHLGVPDQERVEKQEVKVFVHFDKNRVSHLFLKFMSPTFGFLNLKLVYFFTAKGLPSVAFSMHKASVGILRL